MRLAIQNFCSFLSLNFLFWQTEVTPNWQNLSGFKKRSHLKCPSPVHDRHTTGRVTKDQCGKVAHAGDIVKPFLAGLLPRGLATSTDDEQRELGLAKRDQCHWAHRVWNFPMGLKPPGTLSYRKTRKPRAGGQGYQGHAQSPNPASLARANQTSIHR